MEVAKRIIETLEEPKKQDYPVNAVIEYHEDLIMKVKLVGHVDWNKSDKSTTGGPAKCFFINCV